MTTAENIQPVTALKTHAARLLKAVGDTRRPLVITQNGEPKGVLMDFASYHQLRASVLMLKLVAQGEADVRAGRTTAQDKVFSDLRARFGR
jgi:prevent-host-death family protein